MAEVVGLLLAGGPLIVALLPVVIKVTTSFGVRYRHARFGHFWGRVVYLGKLIDTDALQQKHWDINRWKDQEVMDWKAAHLASCSAIAVAGAIFATVGLTALQLPLMNTIHWSARACCVSSMVLGVTSVTTATRQYRAVGMLNSHLDVRLWLSRGRPTFYGSLFSFPFMYKAISYAVFEPANKQNDSSDGSDSLPAMWNKDFDGEKKKYEQLQSFEKLPLESSVSALKTISLPRHLLDLAVILYLVGFGLYELLLWRADAGKRGVSDRNIFIVFITTLGLYVFYHLLIGVGRILDENKRKSEFELDSFGGFDRPEALQDLETELMNVQKRISTIAEVTRKARELGEELKDIVKNSQSVDIVAALEAVAHEINDAAEQHRSRMQQAGQDGSTERAARLHKDSKSAGVDQVEIRRSATV